MVSSNETYTIKQGHWSATWQAMTSTNPRFIRDRLDRVQRTVKMKGDDSPKVSLGEANLAQLLDYPGIYLKYFIRSLYIYIYTYYYIIYPKYKTYVRWCCRYVVLIQNNCSMILYVYVYLPCSCCLYLWKIVWGIHPTDWFVIFVRGPNLLGAFLV